MSEKKVVIFHGFEREELGSLIKVLREKAGKEIIMAVTTETSLEWKVKDLIKELIEEDEFMKKKKRLEG